MVVPAAGWTLHKEIKIAFVFILVCTFPPVQGHTWEATYVSSSVDGAFPLQACQPANVKNLELIIFIVLIIFI